MMGTLRVTDTKAEIEVSKYLDEFFYPEYVDACFREVKEEEQLAGVDTVVKYGESNSLKVDEKCAAHYVNRDIPTFAFEVNFINQRGELSDGWLFNQNLKTEYYLLTWLWAAKERDFKYTDIQKARVMFVNRVRLLSYLKSCGITREVAYGKATISRLNQIDGPVDKINSGTPYYFLSQRLSEKPFNVIVPRIRLAQIADIHVVVGN